MRIIHLFGLMLLTGITWAQNGSINGRITDAASNEPLEYASVALYKKSDSTLVTGVITNHEGNFRIEKLGPGQYYLRIQFLGYERKQTGSITVGSGQSLPFVNISLSPSRQMIGEVNVTGRASNATSKLEKQIFRAAQFESARGGSAVDVLKNMPSVAVNGQGEISVRGSSGFLVLINGKPVLTDAQTALSQLPANMVDQVELITSPSARYDPDGKAGIINIVTKKGANDGKSLVVNAQYGLPSTTDYDNARTAERYGTDILYNSRKGKWDITLGGNFNRNDNTGYREGDVWIDNVSKNTVNRFPSAGERSYKKYYYSARTSINFTADGSNLFSLGLFSGKRYQERDANLFYSDSRSDLTTGAKIYDSPYYNANKQIRQGTFTLGNFDYTHTFTDKSTLTATLLYEYDNLYGNTYNHNLTKPGGTEIQYVENPYKKPINGFRFNLDHSVSIGKGRLESGYQFRSDSQDGVFDYFITPIIPNQPGLERFRGTAVSKNRINSVYSQYSSKQEKLEYNLGLRYEYSSRTFKLSYDPLDHVLNLSSLFPSANILYHISPDLRLKAGFSRRIERATNNQLNPIPEREHSETLEVGDPDLLPEFASLGEAGLTKVFKNGSSLSLTAYFRNSKNPVQRVNSIYADTILNRVYTNVDKGNAVGFETGADLHPAKWWSLYFGANIFKQTYKGIFKIVDSPAMSVNNSGWVYSVNANTNFSLSSSLSLQANINYLSKRPTAQGEDSRFLVPNMTLKKNFLKNRMSASLQWQSIDLGMKQSNRQRITTRGDHFYTTTNYIYETDYIMLNLSYNLNRRNGKVKLPNSEFGEKEF